MNQISQPVQSYDRISTQADKLRTMIRYIGMAHDLMPRTLLVSSADASLDWIDDDFATILGKLKLALVNIDALLDEMEQ